MDSITNVAPRGAPIPRFNSTKAKRLAVAAVVAGLLFGAVADEVQAQSGGVIIVANTPQAPTEWALLQREIFRASEATADQYAARYFDSRGYILSDLRWGMNDGPDDAFENINRWPEIYSLGGAPNFMEHSKRIYDGLVRQYTEEATRYVPFAKDGMYYKEFPVHSDWMHHSEGIQMFNNMALMDPYDPLYRQRVQRFAGFYMNEDPGALNYDPIRKIIRSTSNGSRGPIMRLTTAVDWVGDPTEMVNRYGAGHGEENYEEMLFHYKDYHDTVGDHPLNLLTTNLALNAYAITGDTKYKDWLLEYVGAWRDRMEENNWVIPSNVGLDGKIGSACGKWYCGAYGWSFTVDAQSPAMSRLENRQRTRWGFPGFMNAYMLSGDDRFLDAWRKQDDVITAAGEMRNGVLFTPEMYGNPEWSREGFSDSDGWYSFRPREQENMLELYWMSWKPEDRARVTSNTWLDYLEGNNPEYPVEALRSSLADIHRRAEMARSGDTTTPDTRLVDDPMGINPIQANTLTALNRLMVGGLYMYARSLLIYTRLRYFDVERSRPGVPEDVAALVEKMTDNSVTVSLINISPTETRTMIVQGGGMAEHQIVSVTQDGVRTPVNSTTFRVVLEPGSGTTLEIEQRRFVNQPTLDFPWRRAN